MLANKKQKRNGVRLNANKEVKRMEDLVKAGDDLDLIRLSIIKLESYVERLQILDDEIVQLMEKEDPTAEDDADKSVVIEDSLLSSVAVGKACLEKPRQQSSNNGGPSSSDKDGKAGTSVKLPKLDIEAFSGDAMKWQEFWDCFKSTIHENSKLSAVEKFKYLKSFLSGDALRLAEGYRLTAATYDEVVQALSQRFGDPELAIFSHLDAMQNIPTAANDLTQLQRVFDESELHIRSLVALGLTEDTFGKFFTPIVLAKVPMDVRIELHRRKGDGVWTLSLLRKLLREEITARQMSFMAFGSSAGGKANAVEPKSKENRHHQISGAALVTSTKAREKKQQLACRLCGGGHWPDKCTKYGTLESRQAKINQGGLCRKCLKEGHHARQCPAKSKCFFCKKDDHHSSICAKKFGKQQAGAGEGSKAGGGLSASADSFVPAQQVLVSSRGKDSRGKAFWKRGYPVLQTALATVKGPKGSKTIRLVLDTASTHTFCNSSVCKEVGAKRVTKEKLAVGAFESEQRKLSVYELYHLTMMLLDGTEVTLLVDATKNVTTPTDRKRIFQRKFPGFEKLPLADPVCDDGMEPIDMLVGQDYYYDFVGDEIIRLSDGLVLLETRLGYVIGGCIKNAGRAAGGRCLHITCRNAAAIAADEMAPDRDKCILRGGSQEVSDKGILNATAIVAETEMADDADYDLRRFWQLEDAGIKDVKLTPDDEKAQALFDATVRFNDEAKRYEVCWPWKEDNPCLPSNYVLARARLSSLVRRCDPKLLSEYCKVIEGQLDMKVIEPAPEPPDGDVVHYIPHHCVVRPGHATTKIRVVYDASCKARESSTSLNECLYRGPVLLADLCGLLMRFRCHAVGITSDIEKAFLQIMLRNADRDVTRFLWLKDLSKPATDDNLVTYRFCRVPFGVVSSPFLLAATVRHHLGKADHSDAADIMAQMYVDNVINGRRTAEQAKAYYAAAKSIFGAASMNLREWFSNDAEFMSSIPEKDRGVGDSTQVLGLKWDLKSDTINCCWGGSVKDIKTKRESLKMLAMLYDPLGFFSPVIVRGKMLLQQLWKAKIAWDDAMPVEMLPDWANLLADLHQIPATHIPRCVLRSRVFKMKLHCFCDASERAYCAVVYLVIEEPTRAYSNIVYSKCRVSPIKSERLTIPKLELLALATGSKVLAFVRRELILPIESEYLWSDSQCALAWVTYKADSPVFVRNRVNEVSANTSARVLYVPTDKNPADIATRGASIERLKTSNWWNGPDYLVADKSDWPTQPPLRNDAEPAAHGDAAIALQVSASDDTVFDINRFSSLAKLVHVSVYVRRWFKRAGSGMRTGSSDATEYAEALAMLVKLVQQGAFAEDLSGKGSNMAHQLGLFKDSEGAVRCSGRLDLSDLPYDAKYPLILPRKSHLTSLIVLDVHKRLFHAGAKHTLAEVRNRYWIPCGRAQVKGILKKCLLCKRLKGGPFRTPDPPPLPSFRTSRQRPFACVGLDYLGPVFVKGHDGSSAKVWICLFTCTSVRAIHLEVVENMTTAQFLMCVRRFVALCGLPDLIFCDNAGQFRAGKKVVSRLWKEAVGADSVAAYSAHMGIQWLFNVELAPWMGGFYERLVGLVKKALRAALHCRRLSLVEMQTVVHETAAVLNTRPLTYAEDEVGSTVLTPAKLLLRGNSLFPVGPTRDLDPDFQIAADSQDQVIRHWKRLQAVVDSFWKMWHREYLQALREQIWKPANRSTADEPVKVGAVVQIHDRLPRCRWKVGKIAAVHTGNDGLVRSAKIQLPDKTIVQRPIRLLFPLEVPDEDPKDAEPDSSASVAGKATTRPRRYAAEIAREKWKRDIDEDSRGD